MSKALQLVLGMCFTLVAWGSASAAPDKLDGLTLLEKHPEFATVLKVTTLNDKTTILRITLCRSKLKTANCEMFEGNADHLQEMADYVTLYAVYQGRYDRSKSGAPEKTLADGLLQEAAAKGYGQALLDHYNGRFPCPKSKSLTTCILHKLSLATLNQRYVMEPLTKRSGYVLLRADEQGQVDPTGD